jgi:hypothetical protein
MTPDFGDKSTASSRQREVVATDLSTLPRAPAV